MLLSPKSIGSLAIRLQLVTIALMIAHARDADAQMPKTYVACYVPLTGTVYRIKETNLKPACTSGHIEFSWTDGSSSGGGVSDHGALTGLADDDHPQYLLGNGVRATSNGFAVTGTIGTGTTPVGGAGVRLMWYPGKAAFRAGRATGSEWDDFSTGIASTAFGDDTRASGDGATAFGQSTVAAGATSFAFGSNSTASAASATAGGDGTTATGVGATAFGRSSFASGEASSAFGNGTIAQGASAMAFGLNTRAMANSSTAGGDGSVASGASSTAFGVNATASGDGSVAIGNSVQATGLRSTAFSDGSVASGYNSVALAGGTASGGSSLAVSGRASGDGAMAFGFSANASGRFSVALGRASTNGHEGSFVFGDNSSIATVVSASRANQFVVRADHFWFGTTGHAVSNPAGHYITTTTGAFLSTGGTWTNASDVALKGAFADVDANDVLNKIAALRIRSWSYNAEDASVRHVGPTAQDFHAAFGLGNAATSIATVDADGVSLLGIQALVRRTTEQAAQIDALRKDNDELRARLGRIEALLNQRFDK